MSASIVGPDTFDDVSALAFQERMSEILNASAVATMTSIGHRSGPFDAMAGLPPSTSAEVADRDQCRAIGA